MDLFDDTCPLPAVETPSVNQDEEDFYGVVHEGDPHMREATTLWDTVTRGTTHVATACGHTYQVDLPSGRHYVLHAPPGTCARCPRDSGVCAECLVDERPNTALAKPSLRERDPRPRVARTEEFLQQLTEGDRRTMESGSASPAGGRMPLLVFFHGLGGCAWYLALVRSGWRALAAREGFVVAFGQGGRLAPNGPVRGVRGGIAFGDCYWEVRNPTDSTADLDYVQNIVDDVSRHYPIDPDRVYYAGYSNGGIFSVNLAVHFGGTLFAGLASCCGGWAAAGGYRNEGLPDVSKACRPVPYLLIAGSDDMYLEPSIVAADMFHDAGYPVTRWLFPGWPHKYPRHLEKDIWAFLRQHRRNSVTRDG